MRDVPNGSPPERHGAGLGPWDSACRHVANQACLSDARGLLRAEMSPGCRPRGVSPQGRRRHMPRADPVHKGHQAPPSRRSSSYGPAAGTVPAARCADRGPSRSRPRWRQPRRRQSTDAAAADAAAALRLPRRNRSLTSGCGVGEPPRNPQSKAGVRVRRPRNGTSIQ